MDCVEQAMSELKLCAVEYKKSIKSNSNWDGSKSVKDCCMCSQMESCIKRIIDKYCKSSDRIKDNEREPVDIDSISKTVADSFLVSDRKELYSKKSTQQSADACDQYTGIFISVIVLIILPSLFFSLCCLDTFLDWRRGRALRKETSGDSIGSANDLIGSNRSGHGGHHGSGHGHGSTGHGRNEPSSDRPHLLT